MTENADRLLKMKTPLSGSFFICFQTVDTARKNVIPRLVR